MKRYLIEHVADVLFTTVNHPAIHKLQDGSRKIHEMHFSADSQYYFMQNMRLLPRSIYKLHYLRQKSNLQLYSHIVLLTERDDKLRGHPENSIVIPNFITVPIPEYMPDHTKKQAISVGRLDYPKGYDLLFVAWQQVHAKHPDWHLAIYGHSYGRKQGYQDIIDCLGLHEVIHLYDPVRNIVPKYLGSSFYVMSSRYEGFPLVLPEAMACGLPCVSFDLNCGPSDIIRHKEDGLLVHPNGDIGKLSEAICWMIEHPEDRAAMGKKAKSNISRFAIDSVMKKWVKLIEE